MSTAATAQKARTERTGTTGCLPRKSTQAQIVVATALARAQRYRAHPWAARCATGVGSLVGGAPVFVCSVPLVRISALCVRGVLFRLGGDPYLPRMFFRGGSTGWRVSETRRKQALDPVPESGGFCPGVRGS